MGVNRVNESLVIHLKSKCNITSIESVEPGGGRIEINCGKVKKVKIASEKSQVLFSSSNNFVYCRIKCRQQCSNTHSLSWKVKQPGKQNVSHMKKLLCIKTNTCKLHLLCWFNVIPCCSVHFDVCVVQMSARKNLKWRHSIKKRWYKRYILFKFLCQRKA